MARAVWESWARDGHPGRGGFPREGNLRRGEGVGLVDEVAEGALQGQRLGGEGAGGFEGACPLFVPLEYLEKGFETRLRQWDYSIMKLVADANGRLACKSLFTPRKAFSAERQADGSIRLMELIEKEIPVVRARKVGGRWMGAAVQLDRAKVIGAIRADREAR